MKVLIDENIHDMNIESIKRMLSDFSINHELYYCRLNKENLEIREVSAWVKHTVKDKVLIIFRGKVNKTNSIQGIKYKGFADKIDGDVAMIAFENSSRFPLLCLHEVLHLMGTKHCKNKGCVMSLKLCDGEFKYCALCGMPCKSLYLCKKCELEWKTKKLN